MVGDGAAAVGGEDCNITPEYPSLSRIVSQDFAIIAVTDSMEIRDAAEKSRE